MLRHIRKSPNELHTKNINIKHKKTISRMKMKGALK